MEELKIDLKHYNYGFKSRFPNRDIISLEELINDYENLVFEKMEQEEEKRKQENLDFV